MLSSTPEHQDLVRGEQPRYDKVVIGRQEMTLFFTVR